MGLIWVWKKEKVIFKSLFLYGGIENWVDSFFIIVFKGRNIGYFKLEENLFCVFWSSLDFVKYGFW